MAIRDDISSTEKLLDAIRNTNRKPEEDPIQNASYGPKTTTTDEKMASNPGAAAGLGKKATAPSTASSSFIESRFSIKSLTGAKVLVVGVVIHHQEIVMVMINRISPQNRELVKYKKVPFSPGINRESKQFPEFLKAALKAFCGSYGNVELWASIPDETLENRYMVVPKVSDKKLSNAVYWSFRKEVPFDESEMIFDYEVLGEVIEDNVKKLAVSAYVVNRQAVNSIKTLFTDIKFPLAGLSVTPFAIQNFFRTKAIDTGNKKVCTVNINLEHSRIDIFSEGNLIMSRNVKTGIDSMIGAIREESEGTIEFDGLASPAPDLSETPPLVEIETFKIEDESEDVAAVSDKGESFTITSPDLESLVTTDYDTARKHFFHIISKEKSVALTDQEQAEIEKIFRLISPVAERLLRQVERTFEYFSRTYRSSNPEILIFSGPTSTYKKLTDYIGNQLGIESGVIDPFSSATQLAQTVPPPRSLAERDSFTHAYGLALSDTSHTPNLIYTYRQKEIDRQVKMVNYGIVGLFSVILLFCFMVLYGMTTEMNKKELVINELQAQIDRFVPNVDQKILQEMFTQVQKKRALTKKFALNCIGTAIISEITAKTPETIKLTKFEAMLYTPSESEAIRNPEKKDEEEEETKKQQILPKSLTISGYVQDDAISLESTLAGYLVDLNRSPMFGTVTIKEKSIVILNDEEVLNFTAIVEMRS